MQVQQNKLPFSRLDLVWDAMTVPRLLGAFWIVLFPSILSFFAAVSAVVLVSAVLTMVVADDLIVFVVLMLISLCLVMGLLLTVPLMLVTSVFRPVLILTGGMVIIFFTPLSLVSLLWFVEFVILFSPELIGIELVWKIRRLCSCDWLE